MEPQASLDYPWSMVFLFHPTSCLKNMTSRKSVEFLRHVIHHQSSNGLVVFFHLVCT